MSAGSLVHTRRLKQELLPAGIRTHPCASHAACARERAGSSEVTGAVTRTRTRVAAFAGLRSRGDTTAPMPSEPARACVLVEDARVCQTHTMSKSSAAGGTKAGRRRATPARRIAPRALKGEPSKARVTIVIAPRDLEWVESVAKRQRTSVSAVINAGVAELKRSEAFRRCLEAAGGTADITDEDMAAAYAQWRSAGLLP